MKPSIRSHRSLRSGITLAELLVVIVILGLLATLVVPNVLRQLEWAKVETARTQIARICLAVDEYAIMNGGELPPSLAPLVAPNEDGETFLGNRTSVPRDPWGGDYVYEPPPPRYRVLSYGADRAPGGTGRGTDIDSWTMSE